MSSLFFHASSRKASLSVLGSRHIILQHMELQFITNINLAVRLGPAEYTLGFHWVNFWIHLKLMAKVAATASLCSS